MAAKGLHVSSKLRHKARAVERKMSQEEKKERKMAAAPQSVGRRSKGGEDTVASMPGPPAHKALPSGDFAPPRHLPPVPDAPDGASDDVERALFVDSERASGGNVVGAPGASSSGAEHTAGAPGATEGAENVSEGAENMTEGAENVTGGAGGRRRISVGENIVPGKREEVCGPASRWLVTV